MTCASCAQVVEQALRETPGVVEASVNLALERVTVRGVAGADVLKVAVERVGYALVEPDAEGSDPESEARMRRLWVAAACGAPLVLLAMGSMLTGTHVPGQPWVELALALPVVLYAAWPFYTGAVASLRNRAANMDVLVAVGTLAAFAYSLAATLAPRAVASGGTYYETAAVIVTLILLGKHLEARSKKRASAAIRRLFELGAREARVKRGDAWVDVPVSEVRVGDVLLVKPGEKIPTDAVVLEGEGLVDESMVTGESMPVAKRAGAEVIGGTLGQDGALTLRATRVGRATMLSQIVQFMERAQAAKAPIERVVDRVTAWFVPTVLALSILTFVAWFLVTGDVPRALFAAIAVVIIACPCAMGLATPMAIMVGMGRGAEHGILVKGAEALERSRRIDVVVLDKTGTVTKGRAEVVDVVVLEGARSQLFSVAMAVESSSEHPLAAAIVRRARRETLPAAAAPGFVNVPGRGARALLRGKPALVGTPEWLAAEGVDIAPASRDVERLRGEARTVVGVALDGRLLGLLALADAVKPTSADAVRRFREHGADVILLTGDHAHTAESIAREVGIARVHAGVLPQDKARIVRDLKAEGRAVMMVGDGVNDAIALAEADLGVAMGGGTDVAREAGHVVLLRDDLRDAAAALDLSRASLKKVRQNLAWAFGYNVVLIPVAALGLLHPMLAAAAMALSSVSVVANSATLKRWRPAHA